MSGAQTGRMLQTLHQLAAGHSAGGLTFGPEDPRQPDEDE